jgi:tetratricopeptide (TPR) repeat protein
MEHPYVIVASIIAIGLILAIYIFAEPAWHADMEKAWQTCIKGDNSQAEEWLKKGLAEAAKYGDNPAPWKWQSPCRPSTMSGELATLADAYACIGNFDRAEWLFKKAISMAPSDDIYYLKGLAEFYSKRGRYTDAEPLYLKIAQDGNFYGLLDLAKCYSEEGKLTDADSAYTEALQQIEKAAPNSGTLAFALTEAGKFHLKNKNLARATELLLRSLSIKLRLDNIAPVEFGCLAEIYAAEDDNMNAERLFKQAIEAHSLVPSVFPQEESATRHKYANLLRRLHRLPDAEQQELAANAVKAQSPRSDGPTIYQ